MRLISIIIVTCAIVVAFTRPAFASGASLPPNGNPAVVSDLQEGAQDSSEANLSGSWQVSFAGKRGSRQATMQLKQEDSKISGTFQGQRGSVPLSGALNGSDISFTIKMPRREVSFTGTVHGNKMSGTTEQGGSWSATRQ